MGSPEEDPGNVLFFSVDNNLQIDCSIGKRLVHARARRKEQGMYVHIHTTEPKLCRHAHIWAGPCWAAGRRERKRAHTQWRLQRRPGTSTSRPLTDVLAVEQTGRGHAADWTECSGRHMPEKTNAGFIYRLRQNRAAIHATTSHLCSGQNQRREKKRDDENAREDVSLQINVWPPHCVGWPVLNLPQDHPPRDGGVCEVTGDGRCSGRWGPPPRKGHRLFKKVWGNN